jgi:hypothetical protein
MKWVWALLAGKTVSRALQIGGLALICAALANPVVAKDPHGPGGVDDVHQPQGDDHGPGGGDDKTPPGGAGGGVPEIDPNSLAGALTLLGGGVLVLTDHLRKK